MGAAVFFCCSLTREPHFFFSMPGVPGRSYLVFTACVFGIYIWMLQTFFGEQNRLHYFQHYIASIKGGAPCTPGMNKHVHTILFPTEWEVSADTGARVPTLFENELLCVSAHNTLVYKTPQNGDGRQVAIYKLATTGVAHAVVYMYI